jgi:hypothetical protein
MIIRHRDEGPRGYADGRNGVEYTLIPETQEDQTFVRQLLEILRQEKFRRTDKSQMIAWGTASSTIIEGKTTYTEVGIGLYEPPKGILQKILEG